jgi:hypothetical protein
MCLEPQTKTLAEVLGLPLETPVEPVQRNTKDEAFSDAVLVKAVEGNTSSTNAEESVPWDENSCSDLGRVSVLGPKPDPSVSNRPRAIATALGDETRPLPESEMLQIEVNLLKQKLDGVLVAVSVMKHDLDFTRENAENRTKIGKEEKIEKEVQDVPEPCSSQALHLDVPADGTTTFRRDHVSGKSKGSSLKRDFISLAGLLILSFTIIFLSSALSSRSGMPPEVNDMALGRSAKLSLTRHRMTGSAALERPKMKKKMTIAHELQRCLKSANDVVPLQEAAKFLFENVLNDSNSTCTSSIVELGSMEEIRPVDRWIDVETTGMHFYA